MQIHWLPLHDIRPYDQNPRKNSKTIEKLMQSLKTYGWHQPIVVDKDKVIVAGHARWQAALQLEMEKVPVQIAEELTESQARGYRLTDNRLAEMADWDPDALANELLALQDLNFDLSLTGFHERELAHLLDVYEEFPCEMPPVLPDPNLPVVTSMGTLWTLGSHRLLCANVPSAESVPYLMQGGRAHLVFMDAPYPIEPSAPSSDLAAYFEVLKTALFQAALYSQPTAALYLCHFEHYRPQLAEVLRHANFKVRSVLIWAKQPLIPSANHYKTQYQPILYCHKKGESDAWYGDHCQSTLWDLGEVSGPPFHPPAKPVILIQQALLNSSLPQQIVLDLFADSGTTLMACEKNKRRAYLMASDPIFTDHMIRQWQRITGESAIHFETGISFDEMEKKQLLPPSLSNKTNESIST